MERNKIDFIKNEQRKISIRFFEDREVRAVCDEQNWWFSVVDVVGI